MDHLKQKIVIFRLLDKTLDFLLIILSVRLAVFSERIYHNLPWYELESASFNFIITPFMIIIWYYLIKYNESEYLYRFTPYKKYFQSVLFVTFLGISTLISIKFFIKYDLFYRSTIVFYGFYSFSFLFFKRVFLKTILNKIRSYGIDQKHILIIGWGQRTRGLIAQFERNVEFGIIVKYIIDPRNECSENKYNSIPVTSKLSQLEKIVLDNAIDEVFITQSLKQIKNIESIFTFFNSCGINYHLMVESSGFDINREKLRIDPELKYFYGIPTISYPAIPADLYRLYIKNFLEKCFAFFVLLLASPCLILFSILIQMTSKGGIFFKQERIGLHGRKFNAIKLRTMIKNAEQA